jgi:formylmethanofuran dehydrogenase subunit E
MKHDKRLRPRWIQRIWASVVGYFWLPCDICGEPFGGHEPQSGTLMDSPSSGKMVCANCAEEAAKRNIARFGYTF